MVLLSTSPGAGGAARALGIAESAAPHFGGVVRGTFSLPKFYDGFDADSGTLVDQKVAMELKQVVSILAD